MEAELFVFNFVHLFQPNYVYCNKPDGINSTDVAGTKHSFAHCWYAGGVTEETAGGEFSVYVLCVNLNWWDYARLGSSTLGKLSSKKKNSGVLGGADELEKQSTGEWAWKRTKRERERIGVGTLNQASVDYSPLPLGSASTGAVWKCWSNISSWLDRAILLSLLYRES